MARYIDADDAIYRLNKLSYLDNQPRAIRRATKYLDEYANEVLTKDVQEVRQGKWLKKGGKIFCSECGTVNFLEPNY